MTHIAGITRLEVVFEITQAPFHDVVLKIGLRADHFRPADLVHHVVGFLEAHMDDGVGSSRFKLKTREVFIADGDNGLGPAFRQEEP
jgi:hypothetical protein